MGILNEEKTVTGTVTETLPNLNFRVHLSEQDREVLTYLGGKMRLHRIKVLVGDKVEVLLSPDGGLGRITRRF